MGTAGINCINLRDPFGNEQIHNAAQSTGPFAMRAHISYLLLTLVFGLSLGDSIHAQLNYDLEVDVVLDTVLYDGVADVPAGFRRYRLYAVLPSDDHVMLGPAADDVSVPSHSRIRF